MGQNKTKQDEGDKRRRRPRKNGDGNRRLPAGTDGEGEAKDRKRGMIEANLVEESEIKKQKMDMDGKEAVEESTTVDAGLHEQLRELK